MRYMRSRTSARPHRVVCLIAYLRPGSKTLDSSIQQIFASSSWRDSGTLCGRHNMSPRLMSISSARSKVAAVIGSASGDRAVRGVDAGDGRGEPAGQGQHRVTYTDQPAGDESGVATVVRMPVGLRADHVLHRKPDVDRDCGRWPRAGSPAD